LEDRVEGDEDGAVCEQGVQVSLDSGLEITKQDVQSESPPAMSVHTSTCENGRSAERARRNRRTRLTIAMHLANPTKMRPSLSSALSGKKAHDRANMKSGAKIQLTKREKARCCQIRRPEKSFTREVGETRQRIGHIMTIRAMAVDWRGSEQGRIGGGRKSGGAEMD
jgi:hypothetical protein